MTPIADLPYDLETERLFLSAMLLAEGPARDRYAARTQVYWFLDTWHAEVARILLQTRGLHEDLKVLGYLQRNLRRTNPTHWFEWLIRLLHSAGNPRQIPSYQMTLCKLAQMRNKLLALEEQYAEQVAEYRSFLLRSRGLGAAEVDRPT